MCTIAEVKMCSMLLYPPVCCLSQKNQCLREKSQLFLISWNIFCTGGNDDIMIMSGTFSEYQISFFQEKEPYVYGQLFSR